MSSGVVTGSVSINNGPGAPGQLTVEREQIDIFVATKSEPDMDWEYVDTAGHFHAFTTDGKLPTLDTREEHVDCGHPEDGEDECEGYDVTVYFCRICGATIKPEYEVTHPSGPESIAGRMSWQVQVPVYIKLGDWVSVKVVSGKQVFFGAGQPVRYSAGNDLTGGIAVETTIVGAGELGQRKPRTEAAA